MKKRSKKKFIFFIVAGTFFLGLFFSLWFILFTQQGSTYVVKKIMRAFSDTKEIVWQKNEGTFMGGMSFKDVILEDLAMFPKPNRLRIQRINIEITSLSLEGIILSIENAKLELPGSDPLLLYGNFVTGELDFTIFTQSLSFREVESLVQTVDFKNVKADFADIDLQITGPLQEIQLQGTFTVKEISKEGFSLSNAPCQLDLTIKEEKNTRGIYGTLLVKEGTMQGMRTAVVHLQESKIFFKGDPQKPGFNLNGISQVGKLKMNIALRGSLDNPDLQIQSNTPASQEKLLLVLATNKTWQNTQDSLSQGGISYAIAKDFIDYFMSGSNSNQFAEKLGFKSLSIKYDGQGKGVAVTKDLSDNLEGRYEIEAQKNNQDKPDINQKVGGEYQVTDSLSIEAMKEFKQQEQTDSLDKKETPDSKILLKFKKAF